MPSHLHQVLLLSVGSDLRYQEIAEASQIPIGTVMSRLSRARSNLTKVSVHGIVWNARNELSLGVAQVIGSSPSNWTN
jgi:hypothetical protein